MTEQDSKSGRGRWLVLGHLVLGTVLGIALGLRLPAGSPEGRRPRASAPAPGPVLPPSPIPTPTGTDAPRRQVPLADLSGRAAAPETPKAPMNVYRSVARSLCQQVELGARVRLSEQEKEAFAGAVQPLLERKEAVWQQISTLQNLIYEAHHKAGDEYAETWRLHELPDGSLVVLGPSDTQELDRLKRESKDLLSARRQQVMDYLVGIGKKKTRDDDR